MREPHHRNPQVWHALSRDHTVSPVTHAFIYELSEPHLPLPSQPKLVLIYRPRRDGRLSWPRHHARYSVVCLSLITYQGRIHGGRAAKSILFFYIVYSVWNKYFWNYDFIVAEIRGVFGSVGVYACVCVSVWSHRPTRQISRFLSNIGGFRYRGSYCFLFRKGPILNDIRGHSDPKNICQIAGNRIQCFKILWGRHPDPPPVLGSGLCPLTGPPFQKFLDPPLLIVSLTSFCRKLKTFIVFYMISVTTFFLFSGP